MRQILLSYTTNGGYDLNITSSFDGMSQTAIENFSNVSGSGNYTTDGDQITVRGSFFDFEVSGVDISEFQEEATATYEINSDGQLRFTQDETLSPVVSPDVTSTSSIRSVSVWERK